jgi:hypothetical protein
MKQFANILCQDFKFDQWKSEICWLKRKVNEGIAFLTMYIDDFFDVGNKVAEEPRNQLFN